MKDIVTSAIRELAPDEVICEPGFYRIPLGRHHDQPCMTADVRAAVEEGEAPPLDQVAVTSGVLRKMENRTPADVWAFHVLNPDRWPSPPRSAALRLGAAMAALIEGGNDELLRHFHVHDADHPRRPTAAQAQKVADGKGTEAGIASVTYWTAVDATPEDWLEIAEHKLLLQMGAVLRRDAGAMAIMGGYPEMTMAYQDEVTGLWVLSRPDNLSFDGVLSDFKKIALQGGPMSGSFLDRRITQHGYHQQMGLAEEAFERLTGGMASAVGLVFQSDAAPHHVVAREIGEEALQIGRFQNRRALDRFAACLESGEWPGPGAHVGSYFMPPDMRERLLTEMSTEIAE